MSIHQRTVVIRQAIIDLVERHRDDVASVIQGTFGISRQAANKHIGALVDGGTLVRSGNTSARRYELCPLAHVKLDLPTAGLREDRPWNEQLRPKLETAPPNVLGICDIAFTELVNNVIDHSESERIAIDVLYTAASIRMNITDRGVGIFKKLKEECGFSDEREVILELAKGKLTTAPDKHTGYGIFFTSRMSDVFSISSGSLHFLHAQPDDDWLMEIEQDAVVGTEVQVVISLNTQRTPKEIYDRFCPPDAEGEFMFSKTHVPIRLAQLGNEQLVSRSQAKRVLNRIEKFSEVLLDFHGVDFIGQAFADEIFRVFVSTHPSVRIAYCNANRTVKAMIGLAKADTRQRKLFP